MKVKELIKNCLVVEEISEASFLENEVTAISNDTREVQAGTLFVCIKGASFDSHDKVEEIIAKGAAAVIVERKPKNEQLPYILVKDTQKALAQIGNSFYKDPSEKLKLVGITGTNGKTTTTHLIHSIVEFCGQKAGIIGTMYNQIHEQKIPTVNTTPDNLTLQKLFAEMNEEEVAVCGMEVSSHGLQLGRTWGIDFDVAVFTNLTQDHLDFHPTMDDYFLAKSLLFTKLGNMYPTRPKTAIINYDDPYGEKLMPLVTANVLSYGCKGKGDIQATNIQITPRGTSFTLQVFDKEYPLTTALIGDFNVYNILAAAASCYALGFAMDSIIEALESVKGVKGRFEVIPSKAGVTAIVDYAHTPDALANVLQTVKKFVKGKTICVVGCGGDRDRKKRPIMADIAMDNADISVFTSDNPRTEDPEQILKDMTDHLKGDSFIVEIDREKAIHQALAIAEEEDVIVVAGKGHENYQIIGKEKIHFDDGEVLMNYSK